jgi:galactose mutarotase-like enzyme
MAYEEVLIQSGAVSAAIAPSRGALTTKLAIDGKDVLSLDRATFDDPAKNVRGGIPVLFPYAGKLVDETLVAAGTKMRQHGFGRNKVWQVVERREHLVRVALAADAETRAQYPFEFSVEQTLMIVPRGLQIELLVCNNGPKPMPVSPGWHPYFCCPAAQKGEVSGDVAGLTRDKLGNDKEFDFGLAAPQNGRASFQVPQLGRLTLSFSPRMRHLQFWSQPGKDFICLEPFTGPNNTINTEKRVDIPPGEARTFWMRIELQPEE